MKKTLELPHPSLSRGLFASVTAYTDEALHQQCGLRIAFTERSGGVSAGSYESLNVGSLVDDLPVRVQENREILCKAFGVEADRCIVPRQVHGDTVLTVPATAEGKLAHYRTLADQGVDSLLVEAENIAALLCFADCVPVIIASPKGSFAVVHAGWRGVENGIVEKTLACIRAADQAADFSFDASCYNVYIGAHIRSCCFATGEEVHRRFTDKFGSDCAPDITHIDLSYALRVSLKRAGVCEARIVEVKACTVCENERFFSYRAQEGVCGRLGAFAVRMRGDQ